MATGLDNGKCTRCGACLSVCPVYDLTRHELFSPRGKARLFQGGASVCFGPAFLKKEKVFETLNACLQCGGCSFVCPAGVEVDDIVRDARRRLGSPGSFFLRTILNRPYFALRLARFLSGISRMLPMDSGLILRLLGFLDMSEGLTQISLPDISPRPAVLHLSRGFYDVKRGIYGLTEGKKTVFFIGCIQNYIYTDVAEAIAGLLGGAVIVPAAQVCCGMPAFASGLMDQARALALANIRAIEDAGIFDAVVTGCASCAAMIRRWPVLFEHGPDRDAALKIASSVMEFGDLLVRAGHVLKISECYAGLVMTYHAPCHERFASGGKGKAGAMEGFLGRLSPAGFRSTRSGCCGHGGVFSLKHAGLSRKIFERRLEAVVGKDKGVDLVVTTCSGCLLQFRMNTPSSLNLKAIHIAEVFYSNYKI
ncbi:(Fe-S)-binding protein [Dissulfurimicrobium hydrothermale]|uniref:(Fe-S)-binding protein n=1 Tax=Dissulfurimicrobium hydrothermale TaxID=1750598 RepID=UPI001EDB03FB|nr:(Fe-S)-binding protein [Dissulfurimicrobium hydrothermale]UKL13431.1 (Fe-S)-binding protein [Dissulfurimicrobium hydrothermale]